MTGRAPASPPADLVVEAYKRDVDRTLFERNLQLTPSERIEQLQRVVAFLCELQRAGRAADVRDDGPAR